MRAAGRREVRRGERVAAVAAAAVAGAPVAAAGRELAAAARVCARIDRGGGVALRGAKGGLGEHVGRDAVEEPRARVEARLQQEGAHLGVCARLPAEEARAAVQLPVRTRLQRAQRAARGGARRARRDALAAPFLLLLLFGGGAAGVLAAIAAGQAAAAAAARRTVHAAARAQHELAQLAERAGRAELPAQPPAQRRLHAAQLRPVVAPVAGEVAEALERVELCGRLVLHQLGRYQQARHRHQLQLLVAHEREALRLAVGRRARLGLGLELGLRGGQLAVRMGARAERGLDSLGSAEAAGVAVDPSVLGAHESVHQHHRVREGGQRDAERLVHGVQPARRARAQRRWRAEEGCSVSARAPGDGLGRRTRLTTRARAARGPGRTPTRANRGASRRRVRAGSPARTPRRRRARARAHHSIMQAR